jgi:hypothetical protein
MRKVTVSMFLSLDGLQSLKLLETKAFSSGALALIYQTEGE